MTEKKKFSKTARTRIKNRRNREQNPAEGMVRARLNAHTTRHPHMIKTRINAIYYKLQQNCKIICYQMRIQKKKWPNGIKNAF